MLIFNDMSEGISYQNQHFYIFDSHSRGANGLSCPNGFCVLGSVLSLNAVYEHILQLGISCGVNINFPTPFALHVINILQYPQHHENVVTIDLENISFHIRARKKYEKGASQV